ncbi:MAG: tetratricopeptide repeat protein [Actinomycetota bacterium]
MEYYDLGSYRRTVTTDVADAQLWFDRGLNWLYAFNHAESLACFERAIEADGSCAMAHWGRAMAIGPNYNLPWHLMDRRTRTRALATAHEATTTALGLLDGVADFERDLIEALPARYPRAELPEETREMSDWNPAFTEAMAAVYDRHGDDLDVVAVYVDAMMNETPWQMWDLVTGEPAEGAKTVLARSVLEAAQADPAYWDHPGSLHLYVHLMEMSPRPELGLRSGDRLRRLVPDGGHLIHMPTHLDVLCGNYHDVVAWNTEAMRADRRWLDREGLYNVYTLYRNHNTHFLIYGALFLGQYATALAAAEELIEQIPEDFLRVESPPFADAAEGFVAMKQHVFVRFGKWREIIDQDLPEDQELYCATTAIMLYAKTVAHAALGEVAEAETSQEAFLAARDRVPDSRRVHNNTVLDLLQVAEAMIDGELAYRKGDHERAFDHLREAIRREDALPYDEPWGWMQPTRHALGALLLEQGRHEEAEAVYRADLGLDDSINRTAQHPNNLWALHGLLECLEQRGETVEASHIRQQLELAKARADVEIKASCYCHQAAMTA